MIFKGQFEKWEPGEVHGNKLVFIGKNLDSAVLRAGFAGCLATPDNLERRLKALRFKVGDRVECNMSDGMRQAGTVVELMWRDEDMEPGQVCPYKVCTLSAYFGLSSRTLSLFLRRLHDLVLGYKSEL